MGTTSVEDQGNTGVEACPPAAHPARADARSRPYLARLGLMSAHSVASRAALAYTAHVRRDPLARYFCAGRADPYPLLERLRAEGPVGASALGYLFTTDHALASSVLTSRAWGVHSAAGPNAAEANVDLSLLVIDPPDHTRLRRIVAPMFARGRMGAYRDTITSTVDGLLDGAAANGTWDVVSGLSAPLPLAVITDLLGIDGYDKDAFLRYGHATAGALDGIHSPRHAAELLHAENELTEVFTRLFEARSREPGDDAISAIVAAQHENRIAASDMVPLSTLLLLAGFETTVNLLSSAVALLLHRPEQWRLLVDDPSLAENAVDETLRYFPPVQLTVRIAQRDTTLGGRDVPAGQFLMVLIAAANRDPALFDAPDVFDITRPNAGEHLAFSAGPHYCVGAPLARLEAVLALQALATRMPDLRLAGPVVPRPSVTLRGPERLLVTNGR